jgi:hypothetical protein
MRTDNYKIEVDIRYLEFLKQVLAEALRLINRPINEDDEKGKRIYHTGIISKSKRQLELIIRQAKMDIYGL